MTTSDIVFAEAMKLSDKSLFLTDKVLLQLITESTKSLFCVGPSCVADRFSKWSSDKVWRPHHELFLSWIPRIHLVKQDLIV